MKTSQHFPITTLSLIAMMFAFAAYASAASKTKVLAAFHNDQGIYPRAEVVFDAAGNLYGTTPGGGAYGLGTVFELQAEPDGSWKTIVLHDFSGGTDGGPSISRLVIDSSGNLYGTTPGGGNSCGCGLVFELSYSNGSWQETVIHTFAGGSGDGSFPQAGLVFDTQGNLYGTTSGGGPANKGTVFELMPSNGGWIETVLYSFTNPFTEGQYPNATVTFDGVGNLYSTTGSGGAGKHGTVFELSPGTSVWTEKVIWSFWSSNPFTGVVLDNSGNIYGTMPSGGKHGAGYVFELTPSAGGWSKKNIHEFTGKDGNQPADRLTLAAGILYGTTYMGGAYNLGVVFKLVLTSSGSWQETLLNSFRYNGANPIAGVVLDSLGNLYGTTTAGGRPQLGVVYEVTP